MQSAEELLDVLKRYAKQPFSSTDAAVIDDERRRRSLNVYEAALGWKNPPPVVQIVGEYLMNETAKLSDKVLGSAKFSPAVKEPAVQPQIPPNRVPSESPTVFICKSRLSAELLLESVGRRRQHAKEEMELAAKEEDEAIRLSTLASVGWGSMCVSGGGVDYY